MSSANGQWGPYIDKGGILAALDRLTAAIDRLAAALPGAEGTRGRYIHKGGLVADQNGQKLPDSADLPLPLSENPAAGIETAAETPVAENREFDSVITNRGGTEPENFSAQFETVSRSKKIPDQSSQELEKNRLVGQEIKKPTGQSEIQKKTDQSVFPNIKPNLRGAESLKIGLRKLVTECNSLENGAESLKNHEDLGDPNPQKTANCNKKTPVFGTSESARLNGATREKPAPEKPGVPSEEARRALQERVAAYVRSNGEAIHAIRDALKDGLYVRPSSCTDWVSYGKTKSFLDKVGA